ncbi:winged helix-turn-helix domain-containing protein [Methanobacterium sp.]|uniref:winged helix-turn-helix domain-containing protein n=1 Tax=Methanobacterium sp. TaxID=2164 RepID=UPI003C74BA62
MLGENDNTFISELPDDLVISSIVEPLSHEIRFSMLKALSTGSMTFKELSQLTNSKGGHLIYHLNKIIDSKLVMKNDASKRYFITDKGMGVMDIIKNLYKK